MSQTNSSRGRPLVVLVLLGLVGVGGWLGWTHWYLPTEMVKAASSGNAASVGRLLKMGAKPDAPDSTGKTPLVYAAEGGHVEAGRVLLDAGAGKESRNAALAAAVRNVHTGMAVLLLQHGADGSVVLKPDGSGTSPLQTAAGKVTDPQMISGLMQMRQALGGAVQHNPNRPNTGK